MKKYYLKSTILFPQKFVVVLIAMVFTSINMDGKIGFAYDAAGNRIKRELVIPQKNYAPDNTSGVKENIYDSIGERSVIFTTDASGIVEISIKDFNEEDTAHVSVFTISGINVLNEEVTEGSINIDLSSSPAGVYILNVRINESQTTWKITKK